ncbi:MAG TPA: hypothetical protein VMU69_24425 [Bradyrhizobium sp.]|nr:hypothetical protein [Bradyrhizobium sp.]
MLRSKLVIVLRAVMSFALMTKAAAQDCALANYAQLPPHAQARARAVDPHKGYLARELKPSVYLVTKGGYQALFRTGGSGIG